MILRPTRLPLRAWPARRLFFLACALVTGAGLAVWL